MVHRILSQPVTRRQFALGSAAGAALLAFPSARSLVAAQSATGFSSMGYPELTVTVTETGFEGIPQETAAGRYLLKATGKTKEGEQGAVAFLSGASLGMSGTDLLDAIAATAPPPSGSPAAEGDNGEQDQPLPLFVYQLKFAGGTEVFSGITSEAIIDLTPGEWVAWGDDPTAPQTPAILKVTGEFPTDVQDPEADITATLIDFEIQLEGDLTAGTHTLKVQHHGAQPHFLDIEQGPDGMTKDQVMTAFMSDPSATPEAGALSFGDIKPTFYSPTQSIATVTWHQIDLKAGTYLAACFFATAGTGVPHAFNGMVEVFDING